jgi:glycosyltransferase involved in cell wall biosynthesis
LPVVAQATAGVPEVVIDGRTGLLTPAGDMAAYGEAIRRLLINDPEREQLAAEARRFVREERSLMKAAKQLDAIVKQYMGQR